MVVSCHLNNLKNSEKILKNIEIFRNIFVYSEKYLKNTVKYCFIRRNILEYSPNISVRRRIFPNKKIFWKIRTNIPKNLVIFRNILSVFSRFFYKNSKKFRRIFQDICKNKHRNNDRICLSK